MDIQTLTTFLMWCTIINVVLLVVSTLIFIFCPNCIYRMINRWFPMAQETLNVAYMSITGVYKILIIIFNLVPYIAICIVSKT